MAGFCADQDEHFDSTQTRNCLFVMYMSCGVRTVGPSVVSCRVVSRRSLYGMDVYLWRRSGRNGGHCFFS